MFNKNTQTRQGKAEGEGNAKGAGKDVQLVAILSCTGKLIIFMWQRFPNMFLPLLTPRLLLCQPRRQRRERRRGGSAKWVRWWADCMTVMSEVSVSQHSHRACYTCVRVYAMCVCECAFIIRLLMSRKTLRAQQQQQQNVQRGGKSNFWSELNAVFLAANHGSILANGLSGATSQEWVFRGA